jgi:signal transduction histidine kinase
VSASPGPRSPRSSRRDTWNEIEQLRARCRELELTRERLSRLYFSQVEAGKLRMERLRRLLHVVTQLNSTLDLDRLLDAIVSAVQDALGFRVVLLRVLDPESRLLKARAFAGLGPEAQAQLEAESVPLDEFLSWLQDEFRVGRSYFISHTNNFSKRLPDGVRSNLGEREPWEWNEDDVLLVPLTSKEGQIVAYLSVDDPVDRLVPSRETIELLEVFGNHVVVALENARLYQTLKEHTRRLEEANANLGELTRLKTNFLSAITHELRTPLATIRAYTDTLRQAPASRQDESFADSLDVLSEESKRLESLIESALSFSALETGGGPAATRVDLAEALRDCVRILRPAAKAKGIKLSTRLARSPVPLEGDADLLKQLVLQLGSNAVKFTPDGGRVQLRLKAEEDGFRIEVEDTGIGIPEKELPRIFERFYQVESGNTRRFGGTGLGLALCKSVADWHGGRISVRSEVGQGSCFVVELPRRAPARAVALGAGNRLREGGEQVLSLALEMAVHALGGDRGVLFQARAGGELVARACLGMPSEKLRGLKLGPGEGFAGVALETPEGVVSQNAEADPRFLAHRREPYRVGQLLAVPLWGPEERRSGVLVVGLPETGEPMEGRCEESPQGPPAAAKLPLLRQVAQRVEAVLARVDGLRRHEAEVQVVAEALQRVLVHLRRERRQAARRLAWMQAIGERLGLPPAELAEVSLAALVYDVASSQPERRQAEAGAPSDPAEALSGIAGAPPGDIVARIERELHRKAEGAAEALASDEETAQWDGEMGAEILSPLEDGNRLRRLVLARSEWMNGSGGPRGLSGHQIPLGARILAVVDALEAAVDGRVGRAPKSLDQAIQEIAQRAGTQFDPAVIEAVREVLGAGERLDERSAA